MKRNKFGEIILDNVLYNKTEKVYKGREHKYSILLEDGTELIMFPITNSIRGTKEVKNSNSNIIKSVNIQNKPGFIGFNLSGGRNIDEFIYDPEKDEEKAINLFLENENGTFDINEKYYSKYKKIINQLVVIELAKQLEIPTAIYDLATIEGRHELMTVNFLNPNERLITFDQLTHEERKDKKTYLSNLGLSEIEAKNFEDTFNKMELFSYFIGDVDYGPANYGLITDEVNFKIAPMFDKLESIHKITFVSDELINNMGPAVFEETLIEMLKKLDIEKIHMNLKQLGIIIPDSLISQQIDVLNYNYEMLEKKLLENTINMSNTKNSHKI